MENTVMLETGSSVKVAVITNQNKIVTDSDSQLVGLSDESNLQLSSDVEMKQLSN